MNEIFWIRPQWSATRRRDARVRTLWTALPHQQYADMLQQLYRRVHSLGQKHICSSVVHFYFAREKNRRSLRRNIFDFFDQLASIQAGHDQIRKHQIDAALLEMLERLRSTGAREHAIAAGFKHDFSDGKGLFIIVNAEDRSLWFHFVSEIASHRSARP